MKNPRIISVLIIVLTVIALFVVLPDFSLRNSLLSKIGVGKEMEFRQGLDLKGGVNITFKANTDSIITSDRDKALDSAKEVIERRLIGYDFLDAQPKDVKNMKAEPN